MRKGPRSGQRAPPAQRRAPTEIKQKGEARLEPNRSPQRNYEHYLACSRRSAQREYNRGSALLPTRLTLLPIDGCHLSRKPKTVNTARSPIFPMRRWHKVAGNKFKIGQTVFLQPTITNRIVERGPYEVNEQLPVQNDGQIQYRIKGSSEPYERVANESELNPERLLGRSTSWKPS
jgi:hypothetical protein